MEDPWEFRDNWETRVGLVAIEPVARGVETELVALVRDGFSEQSRFNLDLAGRDDRFLLEHFRLRVSGHLARTSLAYVARLNTNVVGHFFLTRTNDADLPPSLGLGWADAVQSQGLGGRCIDLLCAAARAMGQQHIVLTHHPDNLRAAGLYQRKGFRYTGETSTWDSPTGRRNEPRMILDL